VAKYIAKISDPLLDRIDLHVDVARVPCDEITSRTAGESSATIRARVERARAFQRERYVGACGKRTLPSARAMRATIARSIPKRSRCSATPRRMPISLRAASTASRASHVRFADLEAAAAIEVRHVAEAIGYRTLEPKGLAA
jgi:magnesium chelatase family protein